MPSEQNLRSPPDLDIMYLAALLCKDWKCKEALEVSEHQHFGLKLISHTQKWHCALGDLECSITGFLQNSFIYLTLL